MGTKQMKRIIDKSKIELKSGMISNRIRDVYSVSKV